METTISQSEIDAIGDVAGFLNFKPNFLLWAMEQCPQDIVALFTGNQGGKNRSIAQHYALRLMGKYPIEKKNMRPNNPYRVLRFASESLPLEKTEAGEVKNTIYPSFKEVWPASLIRKDITARRPVLTLIDPQGGPDIHIEFVSYNQEVQAMAGHQRWSVYLDEQAPKSFYNEQLPRLLAASQFGAGGDIVIGCTPVEYLTWMYNEIFERAGIIWNSVSIRKYLKEKNGIDYPMKEVIQGNSQNIAVIRSATDDNPIFSKKMIDTKMSLYDDETIRETRRYGIFHQISGVVYKEYEPSIHLIPRAKYFPEGVPDTWLHARGIDFHPHTNWACLFMAINEQNEAFVYDEYHPSPDRMVSLEIARALVYKSEFRKYPINLIDPLAEIKKSDSGLSTVDDLNRYFQEFKRQGICTGGFWQTWDTKNLRGYDIVKERLKNARLTGKPFNNRVVKDGIETFLPTLWILDSCPITNHMMRNWKWEEWGTREMQVTKEEKNKREDKDSHFPITIECIFKHSTFASGRFKTNIERESPYNKIFGRRAA